MAPSLHQLPRKLDDPETRARKPHVDMLVNHTLVRTLKTRSDIIRCLTDFLYRQGFNSVTTPLLGAGAGGAVARPFVTKATEFDGTELNLRIAPELWLKRLVVGGMGKVFEIGPAFRNEGVDNTHNPEFTICEFYSPFTTLPELMETTESLLRVVHEFLSARSKDRYPQLQETLVTPLMQEIGSSSPSYPKLEFVPTLEMLLEVSLPRLTDADASQRLLDLFAEKGLTVPSKPTLPRLLDALAAEYLEPLCQNPTFIINHPVALSPLAKSFTCPKTGQEVSARAELFINAREYANMYEEENSPFEQRKKFVDQLQYRAVDGEGDARERSGEIDESYLEALEWGLPPTGGWGIGIDRLVMLFSGQTRISDVLPFGTLRNIVGLASRPK
ncbi:mitochondrial lysine-tRNA synthetase [Taxawa tesnikishii (nom. ined.)]|nr:mitochondrial lysine-tRNA synthetase [Dothideales sp. JES 119]